MIEIKNLNKYIDKKHIIKNFNITIPDNAIYGLVGVNGAGKSTTLRLISGVYSATDGEILIDGKKVFDNPEVKKEILFINDNPFTNYNQTINDIYEFYSSFYSVDKDKLEYYLNEFQVNKTKALRTFSKGMRRRVILSFAFAIAPKILLLDEAFDGLDPIGKIVFKKELIKLMEEKEMTVVIASHSLRELEDIVEYYGLIKDGEIITEGDVDTTDIGIYKVVLAFSERIDKTLLNKFEIVDSKILSKFCTLFVKGDRNEIEDYYSSLNPVAIEVLDLTLEELFLYKMEAIK